MRGRARIRNIFYLFDIYIKKNRCGYRCGVLGFRSDMVVFFAKEQIHCAKVEKRIIDECSYRLNGVILYVYVQLYIINKRRISFLCISLIYWRVPSGIQDRII